MKIVVCPLSRVSQMVAAHAPERIVSLLDPDSVFPDFGPAYAGRHLRLSLHDVHDCAPDHVLPGSEHMNQLLSFLRMWDRSAPLRIHCRGGIGRSTAVACIAACKSRPPDARSPRPPPSSWHVPMILSRCGSGDGRKGDGGSNISTGQNLFFMLSTRTSVRMIVLPFRTV